MKTRFKTLKKRYVVLVIFLIFFTSIYGWYKYRKSDPTCGKWLFYKQGTQKVRNVEDAMKVFAAFLPSQPYYADHKLPKTLEGYRKKYNIAPFKTKLNILQKNGSYKKVEVYDMLLAYAIDKNGSIYSYNQCSLFR